MYVINYKRINLCKMLQEYSQNVYQLNMEMRF